MNVDCQEDVRLNKRQKYAYTPPPQHLRYKYKILFGFCTGDFNKLAEGFDFNLKNLKFVHKQKRNSHE